MQRSERKQEAADTRRRRCSGGRVERGAQSHVVARKRPLTLKKERFDGCLVVFSTTRSNP